MASEVVLDADLLVQGEPAAPPRLVLSLRAREGLTVISGPSGAGKSTCLYALAGLLRPRRGHVILRGRTLFNEQAGIDVQPRARGVALVFQSLALFPHLTVAENVAFGVPRALSRAERRGVTDHWLTRMRLKPLSERRPGTLSGGEAQRVALARALASAPSLLLLDEPFSALDATLRHELAAEVASVVAELCIPALLVTHVPDDAVADADVIALRDGRRAD